MLIVLLFLLGAICGKRCASSAQSRGHPHPATRCTPCSSNSSTQLSQSQSQSHLEVATYNSTSSTVDVYTLIMEVSRSKYLSSGDFWMALGSWLGSEKARVRIHILTDSPLVMQRGSSRRDGLDGLRVYDIRLPPFNHSNATFFPLYVDNHHSVNPMIYEYLCFLRWHMYRDLTQLLLRESYDVTRIVTLDVDVVVFQEMGPLLDRALHVSGLHRGNFDVVTLTRGAFALWSVQGIEAYSKFIFEWYSNNATTIKYLAERYGTRHKARAHLSDMWVSDVFTRQSAERRCTLPIADIRNVRSDTCGDACPLGCAPLMVTNANSRQWMAAGVTWGPGGDVRGGAEALPYCYAHFQGNSKGLVLWHSIFLAHLQRVRAARSVGRSPSYGAGELRGSLLVSGGRAPYDTFIARTEGAAASGLLRRSRRINSTATLRSRGSPSAAADSYLYIIHGGRMATLSSELMGRLGVVCSMVSDCMIRRANSSETLALLLIYVPQKLLTIPSFICSK